MKRFSPLTIFICLMFANAKAQVNTQDSLALVNIRNTTNGNAWTQKWTLSSPVSNWYGVTITASRVTGISLPNNNLTGTLLSSNIVKLSKLTTLQLQGNHITGNIPPGIGSLTDLEQVDLSSNNFSGTLPAALFNNLSKLTHFNISHNNISGWIPSSIGSAAALVEMDLSNNAFSSKIPTGVNSLNNLTKFTVANNQLVGPLPAGKLCAPSLYIDISGNHFTFAGLECLTGNPNAIYANQHILPLVQNDAMLTVTVSGATNNITYTWHRSIGDTSYIIASGAGNKLSITQNGDYWAVITNSLVPGLTLYTDSVTFTQFASLANDSLALISFYNGTNGPNWNIKWNLSNPVSTWPGIEISTVDHQQRVTGLVIPPDNNTVGTFPYALVNLTALRVLEITGAGSNQVTGSIPAAIRNLTKLMHLRMQDNLYLTGNLQGDIGGLYALVELNLSNNFFTGYLPGFLGMQKLEKLNLSKNYLEGPIPGWDYRLKPELKEIDLSYNKLTGPIPDVWTPLKKLTSLNLSNNNLTGAIPPIGDRVTLQHLDVSHNQLTGYIAPVWCQKENNAYVNISYNRLDFNWLECFGQANYQVIYHPQANVQIINDNAVLKVSVRGTAANNQFKWYNGNLLVTTKTGDSTFTPVAPGFYHATVTNSWAAALTLYTDTVEITSPGSLNTDSLALVDFYNNITSGLNWVLTNPVSTWEGVTLSQGRVTEVSVDYLSGTLSPSLGNLSELRALYLGYFYLNNNLTGNIPVTLVNLTKLEELAIDGSNMTGSIPDDLGRHQQHLRFISLGGRFITGTIPSGLEYASSLTELYMGGSQISGTIPTFFKKLPLFNLELQKNKLSGTIPDSLSSSGSLSSLVLSENELTGTLPPTIRTIFVDISHNKLSGMLPDSLSKFGAWIRLNNNRFTGRVPDIRGSYLELDISNNMLDYIDPVNCGPNGTITTDRLNISNNKFNFTALECVKISANVVYLTLTPQQRIPIINTNPILKAAAGGTLANNTYKWYKNTGYFTTKTGDSTLTITTPGVYHCIVTNSAVPGVELRTHNANISTVSSRKIQPGETGNDGATLNATGKLSVYPNPTGGDFLYIKGLQKAESILLYNAAGQLVQQWQNVNGNQQLNISGVTNGVYMIKVVEKEKQTLLKFVKQ